MNPPSALLKLLLQVSVAFFACMGLAHFFGLKIPVLFVYWDPPFYAYQDKIIAFTLVTYMALFFGASRHLVMVPYALVSIWSTVIGLALVNMSAALAEATGSASTLWYWLITASFGGLACVLTALWVREKQSVTGKEALT